MSNSTTAWMIPATGVLLPLLILVMVRAMAPVAGIPPKSGGSDVRQTLGNQLCIRIVVVADDTVGNGSREQTLDGAEDGDGDGRRYQTLLMVSQFISENLGSRQLVADRETVADGLDALYAGKLLEQQRHNGHRMMAMSDPGIFLLNLGVMAMTTTLTTPMRAHQGSMVSKTFWK